MSLSALGRLVGPECYSLPVNVLFELRFRYAKVLVLGFEEGANGVLELGPSGHLVEGRIAPRARIHAHVDELPCPKALETSTQLFQLHGRIDDLRNTCRGERAVLLQNLQNLDAPFMRPDLIPHSKPPGDLFWKREEWIT
jgi:predicted esterase